MINSFFELMKRIQKLGKSFTYAMTGIVFCLKTQQNAVIHLIATICVIITGCRLQVSADDWRWLVIAIVLVWFAELMNTAFEYLCDVVMPELHISVKRAKDIAAGAVLACTAGAVILGGLTLVPYL